MTKSVSKQLLAVLEKINRPGTFCTSGRLASVLPGLEVAGIGSIALPLDKRQAAELKQRSRQAPYGKGTETLVDPDVRRVWEIDAEQVSLANPDWNEVLKQTVESARSGLGLEKQKLEAHLYKLLLYEPGSFFLPHRDGEKLDRMVATLVIALPSTHEGGELLVRHEGAQEKIDFSRDSAFQTQFAAFYADCEHEIRPVTKGFRLALVYNLTVSKSRGAISAPTSREHVPAIGKLLQQWSKEPPPNATEDVDAACSKLAVLLDHQYTQAGLKLDALKGVDRARADVLFAAAGEVGCDASLALVTYWVTGSAEHIGYKPSRRGRGRYDYDDYGDEDESDDASEYDMLEVLDDSLSVEHFSDAAGRPLAFGSLYLKEAELVSKKPMRDGEPTKEEFEGFTGNAGMTLDRWYHRAAVILWPTARRFDVLCEAGMAAAVGGLAQMVHSWRESPKKEQEALQNTCLDFASRIIANWPQNSHQPIGRFPAPSYGLDESEDDVDDDDWDDDDWDDDDDLDDHETFSDFEASPGRSTAESKNKTSAVSLISLLDELDDRALITSWIRNVLAKDVSVDPASALGDICQRLGWKKLQPDLQLLFADISLASLERHARLLADLSSRKDADPDHGRVCRDLAQSMMAAVDRWDPRAKPVWNVRSIRPLELLPPLTKSFLLLGEEALLDRLVTIVLADPKEFQLTTVQIPVLLQLETWLRGHVQNSAPALLRWLTFISAELKARAARPPEKPADWRRNASIDCKCADCAALSLFLADPNSPLLRLPLATQRRQHLHQTIVGQKLDTTHVTERRGRPYTLVFEKTNGSYDRAVAAYRIDLEHLSQIERVLSWCQELETSNRHSSPIPPRHKVKRKAAATKKATKRK